MQSLPLIAVALSFIVACGATVSVDGDGSNEGGGPSSCDNEPCPGDCPAAPPAPGDSCDLPDFERCQYHSSDPIEDCFDVYECQPVYPEAGAPSEWVFVETIDGGNCEQIWEQDCWDPICDEGDELVFTSCPAGATCYEAHSYDDCDTVELCADIASPQHLCEGSVEALCTYDGATCVFQTSPDCFDVYTCNANAWSLTGGGCDAG